MARLYACCRRVSACVCKCSGGIALSQRILIISFIFVLIMQSILRKSSSSRSYRRNLPEYHPLDHHPVQTFQTRPSDPLPSIFLHREIHCQEMLLHIVFYAFAMKADDGNLSTFTLDRLIGPAL